MTKPIEVREVSRGNGRIVHEISADTWKGRMSQVRDSPLGMFLENPTAMHEMFAESFWRMYEEPPEDV
jgi:hypothetical protein